jgi:tetratricopeptide (TPR) repeat protein
MAERCIALGQYERAEGFLDEAQPIISREVDDPSLACRVHLTTATLWRHRGDRAKAQVHLDKALTRANALDGWRSSTDPHFVQAELALDDGNPALALAALERSMQSAQRSNHIERLAKALLLTGQVLADLGRVDQARASVAAAEGHLGPSTDLMSSALRGHVHGCVAAAAGRYTDAASAFRDAADAASGAGAVLLSIECREDLASVLYAADPTSDEACLLVASTAADRRRLGTPRPKPRARELDRIAPAQGAQHGRGDS